MKPSWQQWTYRRVFAFLSNLAIVVTSIRTPSVQRPCNRLLCSLAATDCLTSVTAQPIFVALRLSLYHDTSTCSYQYELYKTFYFTIMLTSGWSFVFLTVISFDRHYALSRPLVYRTNVTNKGILFLCWAYSGNCICNMIRWGDTVWCDQVSRCGFNVTRYERMSCGGTSSDVVRSSVMWCDAMSC